MAATTRIRSSASRRGVLAAWEPVRAPYRALREPLIAAEGLLNGAVGSHRHRWRRLAEAVGDDQACATAVDELLAVSMTGCRLTPVNGGWRVALLPAPGTDPEEPAALQGLVLLVESAGWARLRRCGQPGWVQVFLDWTNGGNRRACSVHRRSGHVNLAGSVEKFEDGGVMTGGRR